jgi:hypothetical protein
MGRQQQPPLNGIGTCRVHVAHVAITSVAMVTPVINTGQGYYRRFTFGPHRLRSSFDVGGGARGSVFRCYGG